MFLRDCINLYLCYCGYLAPLDLLAMLIRFTFACFHKFFFSVCTERMCGYKSRRKSEIIFSRERQYHHRNTSYENVKAQTCRRDERFRLGFEVTFKYFESNYDREF